MLQEGENLRGAKCECTNALSNLIERLALIIVHGAHVCDDDQGTMFAAKARS